MNTNTFRKRLSVWCFFLAFLAQTIVMGKSLGDLEKSDSTNLKTADSALIKKEKVKISLLPANSDNRVLLLGMANSSSSDDRILFLRALLRSGEIANYSHWFLPFQPYGISLLKQFLLTGDTFAKVAITGIYNENPEEMDSLLVELRSFAIANPEIVKRWVIKTSYPTLNDSERGYTLALKGFFDRPKEMGGKDLAEIPYSIRYQVEALLANAMFSYYNILDDKEGADYNLGYLDANFHYTATFQEFARAFDSLNSVFKAWLPPADFSEVSNLIGYYNKSIQTNEAQNDGLFYYLDSRNEMVNSVGKILSESAKNSVVIMAPHEELVVNDKKVGFESILKGLLQLGINTNQTKRLFSFSGSHATNIYFPADSTVFLNFDNDIISNFRDEILPDIGEDDEEDGYFGDYFLFGFKSKDTSDLVYRHLIQDFYREYEKIQPIRLELNNSHISFKAKDSDHTGIETFALLSIDLQVENTLSDTALLLNESDWNSNYPIDDIANYVETDVPKLRHSSAQIEIAYSFMANRSAQKFGGVLDKVLSENGLGTVGSTMGYRGIALNLLSSGEKNNAKTYTFWGLRGGEYQSSNQYLTGFHFGYLQGSSIALDRKRRAYINVLTYLEGFDSKLSIPIGTSSGSLSNPLVGKSFKTVGTVYGMMLGTTVRLSRIFIHGNVGYGWDLSHGQWTINKSAAPSISKFKYTGLNYGIQAGYKFGLFKHSYEGSNWQNNAIDSAAVAVAVVTNTTQNNPSNYRKPNFGNIALGNAEKEVHTVERSSGKYNRNSKSYANAEDTAKGFDAPIVSDDALKTPQGYHYDFNDAELSSQAVKLLVNRAKSARVVLSGENHRFVKFNSQSEFRWMKLLYEQAGYRNYIQELSPTRALFLERYICKGDTQAKKFIQATASARYIVLFDSLAQWQMSLPESERIHIYGLDVERFADMTVMWLDDIVSRKLKVVSGGKSGMLNVPTSIQPGVKAIQHLGSLFYYNGLRDFDKSLVEYLDDQKSDTSTKSEPLLETDRKRVVEDWRQIDFRRISFNETQSISELFHYLDSNNLAIKDWLGPFWTEYAEAFSHLREIYNWERREDLAQQFQWREETMYRNMVTLLGKYPNEKFFGQFGRCHISLSKQQQDCGWFEYNSILSRLRNRYFKNDTSLMNIGIFYKESEADIDDISSSDLLHNLKIQEEVSALYEATEENTMLYDLNEANSNTSELRKKFNFVVIVGKTQDDETNEFSFSSDDVKNGNENSVNMGVYFGYAYGSNIGKLMGKTFTNYLFNELNVEPQNKSINSYNSLVMGYRSKHSSMQYQIGFTGSKEYANNGLVKLDGAFVMHGLSMYLHNSNVSNNKFLHYGVGMGYTLAKNTVNYTELQTPLNLIEEPVKLVNYRGMPTASVIFGIMKDDVGLDIEAGYRMQTNASTWEYRGSRLPFAPPSFTDGLKDDLLSLPFATVNVRLILPNTQPVYHPRSKDSDDEVAVD